VAEIRLYDYLFRNPNPGEEEESEEFSDWLNPHSLEVLTGCRVEAGLANAAPGSRYQFLRQGYFCTDSRDSRPDALVFNRTVSLRDSWARSQRLQQ
jgi:glutaminyl-tRNA synthetase